jgi:ABC-type dipeptide/oligopeptide/nickel transport system permease subunit
VGPHHHAHLRRAVRFPGILLAIAVAVMGSGMANVIIAVAVFSFRLCPAGARQHAGA